MLRNLVLYAALLVILIMLLGTLTFQKTSVSLLDYLMKVNEKETLLKTIDFGSTNRTVSIQASNTSNNTAAALKQKIMESRRRHAIIVPYREREHDLKVFIAYMGPYLQKNFNNDVFSLYVIEQGDKDLFNRGFLFNVGLREVTNRDPSTQCVSIHDVDLVPRNNITMAVPYDNCTFPIHLGSELSHFNGAVPYDNYAGGVLSMHVSHWLLINGMSNDFAGWGGEDDELFYRLNKNNLTKGEKNMILRPAMGYGRFEHIEKKALITKENRKKYKHRNYRNNIKLLDISSKGDRWKYDGLSDLTYRLLGERTIQGEGSQYFREVKVITVVHNSTEETDWEKM